VKAWVPATVVALLLAGGIGAAAYYTLGRGTGGSPSPTPSVDLHSNEAVMAAVRHYYDVEDKARETGDLTLIVGVTEGPGTPAYENFKAYLKEQSGIGHHAVTVSDRLSAWAITLDEQSATASYTLVQRGHDTNATTGKPIEPDMSTPPSHYKAVLHLHGQTWLIYERELLGHD
jgi:hypothetical protein